MIDVTILQRCLPASIKNALKPHYRKFFPNQLYINFMITFRCNYRCFYCPWVTRFDYSSIYRQEKEPTPEVWIRALDKLPKANIYISGGEPFLFRGLPELVNNLNKHKIVGIVTNASLNAAIYKRITKKVHLNLSFHRDYVNEGQFLKKIDELRKIGVFHLNINMVATPENIPVIPKFEKFFKDNKISFHIDPFVDPDATFAYTPEQKAVLLRYLAPDRRTKMDMLDFDSFAPKRCSAGQNYINIMPDGTVFRCVGGSDYYHSPLKKRLMERGPNAPYDPRFFLMGNIFDPDFKLDNALVRCELPCTAACDRDMAKIIWLKR